MRKKLRNKNVVLGTVLVLAWAVSTLTYIAVTCNIALPNKNGKVWTLHNDSQSAVVYCDISINVFIALTGLGVAAISKMRRREKVRLWLIRRYAHRNVRHRITEGAPR